MLPHPRRLWSRGKDGASAGARSAWVSSDIYKPGVGNRGCDLCAEHLPCRIPILWREGYGGSAAQRQIAGFNADPSLAERFWLACGFQPTGRMHGGEKLVRMDL